MKKLVTVLLVIVAAIAAYSAFSWFHAKNAVKGYCGEMRAGTSLDTARSEAARRGLRFFESQRDGQGRYTAMVTRSGAMGRYVCTVTHDGKQVTRAGMDFHD